MLAAAMLVGGCMVPTADEDYSEKASRYDNQPRVNVSTSDAARVARNSPKDSRGLPLWESNPGADVALYLDFDGGRYSGDSYRGASLDGDFSTFNEEEQTAIIRAAMEVAQGYGLFDVNVTTSDNARRAAKKWAWILITNDKGSSGRAHLDVIGRSSGAEGVAGTDGVFNPHRTHRGYLLIHEIGHMFGLDASGLYNDRGAFREWSEILDGDVGAWMGGRVWGDDNYQFQRYEWMRLQTEDSRSWQDPIQIIGSQTGFGSNGGGGGDGCHSVAPDHSDYCTSSCPCGEGEGDCDNDNQCSGNLVCRQDVGANYGKRSTLDVCERAN